MTRKKSHTITNADVRKIWALHCAGKKSPDIAQVIGCHRSTVRLVLRGRLHDEISRLVMYEGFKNWDPKGGL